MSKEQFGELEKKVRQASDEYMLMFKRSKFLLQQNKSILSQIGGHQAASRQSKFTTPSVTPRTRGPSSSARNDLAADMNTMSKVEQVKQIVTILKVLEGKTEQQSVQTDEQSSRYHYNVSKYDERAYQEQLFGEGNGKGSLGKRQFQVTVDRKVPQNKQGKPNFQRPRGVRKDKQY